VVGGARSLTPVKSDKQLIDPRRDSPWQFLSAPADVADAAYPTKVRGYITAMYTLSIADSS
jgi:hypothetical protein